MVEIDVGKARFSYLGSKGFTSLLYNPENGRYSKCTNFGFPIHQDLGEWKMNMDFYKRDNASNFKCELPF